VSRESLDRAVLDWIAEGAIAPDDDGRFERLALELFAYQHEHNPAYRRLVRAYGVDAESVRSWRAIPAVPTGAFKEARLAVFAPDREVRTFRTSGSTAEKRGELHLDRLEIYEASLLSTFSTYVCPEGGATRFAVLAPSAHDAPDSSLSYMFDVVVRDLGSPESRFYVTNRGWDPAGLLDDLASARDPIALVGTAFSVVHFLDFLDERGVFLTLPEGSRVMETGGFKGKSRELSREELYDAVGKRLGLPASRIVNQYGMCELASQFYEDTIRTGRQSRSKRVPPWVRTRVVEPGTLRDVPVGELGLLVHYDLANTGSVLAVQTSDLGRSVEGGFEVVGRAPNAEARGCSVAADLLLGVR
jgi:hypothetical protein